MLIEDYISALECISRFTSDDNFVATDLCDIRPCLNDMDVVGYGSSTKVCTSWLDQLMLISNVVYSYELSGVCVQSTETLILSIRSGRTLRLNEIESLLTNIETYVLHGACAYLTYIGESFELENEELEVSLIGLEKRC